MTQYVDSSVLVSAFTEEVSSEVADLWLESLDSVDARSSAWCETEVASALAAKVRAGVLSADVGARMLMALRVLLDASTKMVMVERRHFASAVDLLMRSPKPLRAADALHLAVAADVGAEVVTLDKGMAAAGQALGLNTRLLA